VSSKDGIKAAAGIATGAGHPSKAQLAELVRKRKPNTYCFKDDGLTPNNPKLPMVIYRSAVRLPDAFDPAAVFEDLFASNGWGDSWRDSIYDFLHYHSKTHEALGIAKGWARVRFGGAKAREIVVRAGDVIVMPAGTGHKRLSKSRDLLVVGAYPPRGPYDELRSTKENHDEAVAHIGLVAAPACDPVYGKSGPVAALFKA
jgi:uncharacterized protein YjlB